jgi:hypothetical protein
MRVFTSMRSSPAAIQGFEMSCGLESRRKIIGSSRITRVAVGAEGAYVARSGWRGDDGELWRRGQGGMSIERTGGLPGAGANVCFGDECEEVRAGAR